MNQAGRLGMMAGKRLPYKKRVEYLGCNSSINGRAFVEIPNSAIQTNSVIYAGFSIQQIGITSGQGTGSQYGGAFTLYQDEEHNWTRIIAGGVDFRFGCCFLSGWTNVPAKFINRYYDAVLSAGNVMLNGESFSIAAPRGTRPESEYPMCIGPTNTSTKCRNYYFKVETGGVMTYDLVPVVDWSDEPCMYDQVTKTLFYNQGTGAFVSGPDL